MVEETNSTIRDDLKKLNENFDKLLASGKVKGVKLKGMPSKSQVNKGYIYTFYIRDNGVIAPMKVPIEEGTTVIDGAPRLATPEYMLSYKGKPALIQPAWSTKPFSKVESFEEAVKEKMLSVGYKLLANRIEQGAIKPKKKVSGAIIFAVIVALLIGGYFLFFN